MNMGIPAVAFIRRRASAARLADACALVEGVARYGRNRAGGVIGLRGAGADVVAAIEANRERAWQDGLGTLRELPGVDARIAAADEASAPGEPMHL